MTFAFRRLAALMCLFASLAADQPKTPPSRIVFASCINQERPQPVWDAIDRFAPDLFIFMGDNIYADTKDMAVLRQKYQELAEQPGYQKLKKRCPIVATWDDHDYGWNDMGADFPHREESQQIYLDFFGFAKDDPMRKQKGIFHTRYFGPDDQRLQVIMLDTRYHRSPLKKKARFVPGVGPYEPVMDKSATMLGEEQWAWLAGELKKPAALRLLVSSVQLVSNDHGWEKWGNMPLERERLLQLLRDSKAEGVLVLSGDRHHAEISVLNAGMGYPLFDLTSSGMNMGFAKWRLPEQNSARVATMFSGNNFGTLLIDWAAKPPILRMQIRDEEGEVTIQEKISLNLLKPGSLSVKGAKAPAHAVTIDGEPFSMDLGKKLQGKEVKLVMHVAASGMSKTGLVFLNSSANRAADNFTVVLDKMAVDQLKSMGVANARTHYEGKTIRVTGILSSFRDQPQIVVSDAAKIQIGD